MPPRRLALTILSDRFAICRLPASSPVPDWATRGRIFSVTRTADELSITCEQSLLPPAALDGPLTECKVSKDWRGLKFEGPFDFSETGVLDSVVAPLADARISIFAISTYDTDYLFVGQADLGRVRELLISCGHILREP